MVNWTYRGTLNSARLRTLITSIPLEEIVGCLRRELRIVCCHTKGCDDRPGYKRVLFCVEVSPTLFDLFFNSQFGYRGWYFESPERGSKANAFVLSTIAPSLLTWARKNCKEHDPAFAEQSMLAHSAKVWLTEEPLAVCEKCRGEWHGSLKADVEIENGRWELDSHAHAAWGRQAYSFRKLRFIGAFLNSTGDEYLAPHKHRRAFDICARGWS